jgi:hypothetical protein
MAGTADNTNISAADWWPLLSELLVFVSQCVRSDTAAKELLLDHFAADPIAWRFDRCKIEAPETTLPPERWKQGLPPISPGIPGVAVIDRCFWMSRDYGQFNVDWEASSASYSGPLIELVSAPDGRGGHRVTPFFDSLWRVNIRVTLIRISAAPIIARLRSLKLLPPAAVSVSAPLGPSQPAPAMTQFPPKTWLEKEMKGFPQRPRESKNDWARRLYGHMKKEYGEGIPWTEATLRRRLDD